MQKLTEMSVTLHRRFRGLTISDMYGAYGTRRETQGRWLDYDPDLDGEVHPLNIVQPAIRTNTSACLQSNPEIDIESDNLAAQHRQIAVRWQRVADYLERMKQTTFSEDERAFLFDAVQKDGVALIYTCGEKYGESSVPNVSDQPLSLGVYKCDCGAKGVKEMEQQQDGATDIDCPNCGKTAKALVKSLKNYELGESQVSQTEIKRKIVPFYNFIIDAYGAKLKGIDSAKWLALIELVDRPELEAEYDHFEFGSPMEWSHQTRTGYALASCDWRYLNAWINEFTETEFERFEKKSIYLHEEAYANYCSPDDYEFVNGKGKKVLSIRREQTIKEALTAQYGDDATGIKFIWTNERLIDIASCEDEETDFRKCFSAVHWLRDSSGFYSSPYYSIVIIQDDITLLNTMHHNIIARNAVVPVYYDPTVLAKEDFGKELVAAHGAAKLTDRDITKSAFSLPTPQVSPYLSNQLQFLWQIKDEVTQVTPALRGQLEKGETYGAQRQALEQSYGLLTPVLKSWAQQGKVRPTIQAFNIIKKTWTLKQFQSAASSFGEIWTDEDVQEMCEIDFERDLIVDYRDGSEMPQSNMTRDLKYYQALSQLLPFIQANPNLLGTDKFAKIVQGIGERADLDFDLTGLDVAEMLSQKRTIELQTLCQPYADVSLGQIDIWKETEKGMDQETGEPITEMDLRIERAFYDSQIRFSPFEDLAQQKTAFIEALQTETGKNKSNYFLIEMFETVIGMIDQAVAEIQQEAMANDPQTKIALQLAEKQKQNEAAATDKEREHEVEDKDRAFTEKMLEKEADHKAAKELQPEEAVSGGIS